MEVSRLSKKSFRYIYLLNPYYYCHSTCSLFSQHSLSHRNLVSPKTYSDSTFIVPTCDAPYSLISSTGSFLFCSKTYPSPHSSYLSKYHNYRSLCSFSSTGFTSFRYFITYPCAQSSKSLTLNECNCRFNCYKSPILNISLLNLGNHGCCRCYSVLNSDRYRHKKTLKSMSKEVLEIVDLISRNGGDLESRLGSLNVSIPTVTRVFRVLSSEKLSGLRFFHWIIRRHPKMECKADICSLIIDNCGHLDDYDAMRHLLNDFKMKQICLTKKAFRFLPVLFETENSMRESAQKVIDVLHEVGGSCYSSGVNSLIEMYSGLGYFDMAKFVIEKTQKKMSCYNVLILEMCRRCDSKGARDMLDEMRKDGHDPTTKAYNYVISSLLKSGKNAEAQEVFQEMQEKGCPPDALTFEIFICNACERGEFHIAAELLYDMKARGLEPRPQTHAIFMRKLFKSQQNEEAYDYLVCLTDKFKLSGSMNYNLLVKLHWKTGNLVLAENVMSEMIKKGLRPDSCVTRRILKGFQKANRKELAQELQEKLLQFESKS